LEEAASVFRLEEYVSVLKPEVSMFFQKSSTYLLDFSCLEVEIAIAKLNNYKLPGKDEIRSCAVYILIAS
jgi:hypothetical protein